MVLVGTAEAPIIASKLTLQPTSPLAVQAVAAQPPWGGTSQQWSAWFAQRAEAEAKPGPPVAPTAPPKERVAEPERFVPGVVRPGYAGPAPGISGVGAVPTKKIVGKIAPKVPEPRPVRLAGEPEPAPAGIAYRSVGVGRPYIPYSTRAVQIMAPGATQKELAKSYKGALARAKELAPHTPGWAGMGKAEKSVIHREVLAIELARRGVARVEREPMAIPPEPLEAKPVYIRFKSAGTTVVLRLRRGQEKFVIEQLKDQGVPAKAIKPTKTEIAKALSIEQYGEWQRVLGIVRPPTAEGIVTLPPTLAERRIGVPPTEGPLARLELGAPRRLPLPRGLGVIEAPALIFAPPGLPAEPAPRWAPSPAMERLVPVYAPYYTKPRPPGLPAVPKEAVPISEVVSGVAERIKAVPIIGTIAEIAYRPVGPFVEPAAGFALGAAEAAVYAPIMAMEYVFAPPVRKVEIVRETLTDWWKRPVALGVAVSPGFGVGYAIGGFWAAGKMFGAPGRLVRHIAGKPTALQIPWVKVRKVERITKIPEPGLAAYYEAAAVRLKPKVGIGKPGAILGPKVEVARVLTKGEVFVPAEPTYEPLPKYYGDIVAPIRARAEAVSLIEVAGKPDIKRIGAVSKAFDVAEIPAEKFKTTFAYGKADVPAKDIQAVISAWEYPKRHVFVGVAGEPMKPPTTVSIGAVEKYVGKVGERREMVRVKGMEAFPYEPPVRPVRDIRVPRFFSKSQQRKFVRQLPGTAYGRAPPKVLTIVEAKGIMKTLREFQKVKREKIRRAVKPPEPTYEWPRAMKKLEVTKPELLLERKARRFERVGEIAERRRIARRKARIKRKEEAAKFKEEIKRYAEITEKPAPKIKRLTPEEFGDIWKEYHKMLKETEPRYFPEPPLIAKEWAPLLERMKPRVGKGPKQRLPTEWGNIFDILETKVPPKRLAKITFTPEKVREIGELGRKIYGEPAKPLKADWVITEWAEWLKTAPKPKPRVRIKPTPIEAKKVISGREALQEYTLTTVEQRRVAEAVAEAVSYEAVEAVMPKRIPAVAPAMIAGMIAIPKEAVVSRVDIPRPEPARVRMRDVSEAIKVKPAMAPIEIMAPKITPREILLTYDALAPAQATRVGLALRAIAKPKMAMAPRIKIDILDIPPEEPVTPRIPFKIILPEPEKKEKKKRRMKRIGRATKYQPSLIAQELDIRGKRPKILTGLEIRPMRL